MPDVLHYEIEAPRPCSYLPGRDAVHEILVLANVRPLAVQRLLERGYRHFGPVYFRPICETCSECVSIRVPVDRFRPSRTQRRVLRNGDRWSMAVGAPETSPARLELLKRWHQNREEQRSWEPSRVDAKRYRQELGSRHASAMEFTFSDRQSGALVGVGIWDRMPDALSAVYFYYDPAYGKYSLGVLNVLRGIALAKAEGLRYVYLGYRVLGCPSLRYKSSFRPHETLVGRPMPEDAPRWEAEAMNIADDGGVQS